jgi:hypothetical protein
MFGYIVPNKAELKFREFDVYRSHYCGLCASIRKRYGYIGALSLTYDLTFLSMLLHSLYEPNFSEKCVRCICHPFKKHCEITDKYSDYAADMSILLSYYKCLDDFHDDKSIPKGLYALFLRRKKNKISSKYPEKAKITERELKFISLHERDGSLEENANSFGRLTAAIFSPEDDIWKSSLEKIGFYLGKFIYILDAYDDVEDDIKKKRPNPLISLHSRSDFKSECESVLNMMAAECAGEFEKLPIIKDAEILRNILYAGIWTRFSEIKQA